MSDEIEVKFFGKKDVDARDLEKMCMLQAILQFTSEKARDLNYLELFELGISVALTACMNEEIGAHELRTRLQYVLETYCANLDK